MDDGPRDERRVGRVLGKVIKATDSAPEPAADRAPAAAPSSARAARPGVLNAEEFEARSSAQKIVEEARRTAQELLDQAQAQAQALLDEANQQAQAVGEKVAQERDQALQEVRAEARAEMSAQVSAELAKAKMQVGQLLATSEAQVVELALKVAEKIIGQDLKREPEVVLSICALATEHARASKAMVMRVNPHDAALLREKRPKLMELVGRAVDIAIREDPDVDPGGCIVQTEFGTIDAQLKTQFEMLRHLLAPDTARKEQK